MEHFSKRAPCERCRYTPGLVRDKGTGRWAQCHCGRMPNSANQAKLDKQARLEQRLSDLREGKPW